MEAQTPVMYLKCELSVQGSSFIKDWKELSAEDKEQLKSYAKKEMEFLGIQVKSN